MKFELYAMLAFLSLTGAAQAQVTGCTAAQMADNGSFAISGSNLTTATTLSAARDYAVCVIDKMSGVANSNIGWPLTVHVTGGGGGPAITVNGQSSGASVSAGASITVAVSGGPGSRFDWMGICNGTPSQATCSGAYSWLNLNCTQTPPATGVTSASCSMTAPGTAGTGYTANFFACPSGGCTESPSLSIAAAPFTVTGGGGGGGGGGSGCQDSDTLTGMPAGWTCDSSMSDDFDRDGSINGSKWWGGTPWAGYTVSSGGGSLGGPNSCTVNGVPNPIDSLGVHQGYTYQGSNTWTAGTQMGAQQPPGHGLPPANYYLEYKWQYKETPFPNNGVTYWANPGAFWTWGVGSAYGSYSATFPEMDWPMGGHVEWLFHGNADWNGPIIDEKKNLSQIGPGVNYPALVNTGWHVTAQLRLNGTRYYYQDAALTYTLPDPYPQYDNNTETPQWSGAFQTQSQSNCPALAGATGVTNDFIIAYIHAYHP